MITSVLIYLAILVLVLWYISTVINPKPDIIEKFKDVYEPSKYKIESVVKDIYQQLPNCYKLKNDNNKEDKSSIYGTLTSQGIDKILKLLKSLSFVDLKKDTFYDLGSGCGELLLEFWLKSGMTSKGLESIPKRVENSQKAIELVNTRMDLIGKTYLPPHNPITFEEKNVAEANLEDANVIYWSNLCFPSDIEKKIVDHLLRLPNLKVLMLSKTAGFKKNGQFEKLQDKLPKYGTLNVSQSWTKSSTIHFFHL